MCFLTLNLFLLLLIFLLLGKIKFKYYFINNEPTPPPSPTPFRPSRHRCLVYTFNQWVSLSEIVSSLDLSIVRWSFLLPDLFGRLPRGNTRSCCPKVLTSESNPSYTLP